jgi:hypothetical protein
LMQSSSDVEKVSRVENIVVRKAHSLSLIPQ